LYILFSSFVAGECVGIPSIVADDTVLLSISVLVDSEEYNINGDLIEGGILKEYTKDGSSPAMMNNDATTNA